MTAPLLDAEGRTAFFLGGQINCSTTIHNCSDILRLLSMSDDAEVVEDPHLTSPSYKSGNSGLNGFFKALRGKTDDRYADTREAGMEQHLINKIEKMTFKDQMEAFYTAYSKVCPWSDDFASSWSHNCLHLFSAPQYLVLSYDTFNIAFYSSGIVEMLCLDPKENLNLAGNNVFRVLAQHAPSMARDFKSRIKNTLKGGRAISADINLVTKKSVIYRRTERLATHWTPLKDERANVKYIVVTLAVGL
jgi:hypothetical protein